MKRKVMMVVTAAYLAAFFTALKLISGGFIYPNFDKQQDDYDGQTAEVLMNRELLAKQNHARRPLVSKFKQPDDKPQEKSVFQQNFQDLTKDNLPQTNSDFEDVSGTTEVPDSDISGEINTNKYPTAVPPKIEPEKPVTTKEDKTYYIPWNGQRIYEENVNPYPFEFTLSASPCRPEHELVIAVHSAAHYHKRRSLIRSTWLDRQLLYNYIGMRVKIVFFVGYSGYSIVNSHLSYELDMYDDVVQSQFVESYYNNTYKAMSYMRWVTENCRKTKLIMKTDDDSLLHPENMVNLTSVIHQILKSNNSDVYLGFQVQYPGPNRNEKDKWYISRERWPYDNYPTWFQGLAYFLTPSLAEKLVPISLNVPYIFMDDVYVGMLVSQVRPKADIIINQNLSATAAMTRFSIDYYLHERWISHNATFFHMPNMWRFNAWYHQSLNTLRDMRDKYNKLAQKWTHHL